MSSVAGRGGGEAWALRGVEEEERGRYDPLVIRLLEVSFRSVNEWMRQET